MSASPSGWAAGILLIVAGVWVLLQTLVGDLPGRIVGHFSASSSVPTGTGPGQNPGPVTAGPQGHNDVPAGIPPLTGKGSVAPAPNGQIGVNPNTGQAVFSS